MEVSSYKDRIIKYLETIVFEELKEEDIREDILKIIGRKEYPVIVEFHGKNLNICVGVLTFYVKGGDSEKESL